MTRGFLPGLLKSHCMLPFYTVSPLLGTLQENLSSPRIPSIFMPEGTFDLPKYCSPRSVWLSPFPYHQQRSKTGFIYRVSQKITQNMISRNILYHVKSCIANTEANRIYIRCSYFTLNIFTFN